MVLAKSLFTHLLPDEFNLYLQVVADSLDGEGRALLTFFILEEAGTPAAAPTAFQFTKPAPDSVCAYRYLHAPTAAVAYEPGYVQSSLARHGLESVALYPGGWKGAPDALSFQDIVVVRRAAF